MSLSPSPIERIEGEEKKDDGNKVPRIRPLQVKIIAPQSTAVKKTPGREEIKNTPGRESITSVNKSSKKSSSRQNPQYAYRLKTTESQRKKDILACKKSFRHEFKLSGIVKETQETPPELESHSSVKNKYVVEEHFDEDSREYQNTAHYSVMPFLDNKNNFLEKNFDITTMDFIKRICVSL